MIERMGGEVILPRIWVISTKKRQGSEMDRRRPTTSLVVAFRRVFRDKVVLRYPPKKALMGSSAGSSNLRSSLVYYAEKRLQSSYSER